MAKLHITSVEIQNFRSVGPKTVFELDGLGPVLVLGHNGAGKSTVFVESLVWCLFGRTTKRPRPSDRHVINWDAKRDCYVEIRTRDGWSIRRTRKMEGHNDLLVKKDGDDQTRSTNTEAQAFIDRQFGLDYNVFVASVCFGQKCKSFLEATSAKARKAALERILFIDRLNTYADVAKKEIGDTSQRVELLNERLKGLERDRDKTEERLASSLASSKEYRLNQEQKLSSLKEELGRLEADLDKIEFPNLHQLEQRWELIEQTREKVRQIEHQKDKTNLEIKHLVSQVETLQETVKNSTFKLKQLPEVDLDEINRQHWDSEEVKKRIRSLQIELTQIETNIEKAHKPRIQEKQDFLDNLLKKDNIYCPECGQFVSKEHVQNHGQAVSKEVERLQESLATEYQRFRSLKQECEDLTGSLKEPELALSEARLLLEKKETLENSISESVLLIGKHQEDLEDLRIRYQAYEQQIAKAKIILDRSQPDLTLVEAMRKKQTYDELSQKIVDLKNQVSNFDWDNPYDKICNQLEHELAEQLVPLEDTKSEIEGTLLEQRHLNYIRKAYSDRNKIKKILLEKMIPLLNSRIRFYEDMFDSRCGLRFTNTLGMETNRWDYEEHSGGEQKRVDVVLMFALHDLITAIYGKQCNLMVMDEIDASLDSDGVQNFIELVDRFCTSEDSPSSIFVISHKQELQHSFPSELHVENVGGHTRISK